MMKIGLFPFELVEKSSRIIIYGYGALGHQYLLQIGKSKYCEILYFVDQNYLDYRNDPRCRVVSLETLYREPQENYDRVLIAIDDPEISGKVKETLHMGGIPQERIIVTKETRIYDWDWPVKISEKQLYEEEAALEEYVVNRYDSLAKAKMHTAREYLPDLSALLDVTPDKEELLALLKERLSRMLDGPEKIILLSSDSITGPFERCKAFDESMKDCQSGLYEAPTAVKLDDDRWCLFIDYYGVRGRGQGYVPFLSDNLASGMFTRCSAERADTALVQDAPFSFPYGFKHGTILPITDEEYTRIKDHDWQSDQFEINA